MNSGTVGSAGFPLWNYQEREVHEGLPKRTRSATAMAYNSPFNIQARPLASAPKVISLRTSRKVAGDSVVSESVVSGKKTSQREESKKKAQAANNQRERERVREVGLRFNTLETLLFGKLTGANRIKILDRTIEIIRELPADIIQESKRSEQQNPDAIQAVPEKEEASASSRKGKRPLSATHEKKVVKKKRLTTEVTSEAKETDYAILCDLSRKLSELPNSTRIVNLLGAFKNKLTISSACLKSGHQAVSSFGGNCPGMSFQEQKIVDYFDEEYTALVYDRSACKGQKIQAIDKAVSHLAQLEKQFRQMKKQKPCSQSPYPLRNRLASLDDYDQVFDDKKDLIAEIEEASTGECSTDYTTQKAGLKK